MMIIMNCFFFGGMVEQRKVQALFPDGMIIESIHHRKGSVRSTFAIFSEKLTP